MEEAAPWVEAMAVHGGGDDVEDGKILYTLFGGLAKHPKYRGEDVTIIEKAHAVLAQKTKRGQDC